MTNQEFDTFRIEVEALAVAYENRSDGTTIVTCSDGVRLVVTADGDSRVMTENSDGV